MDLNFKKLSKPFDANQVERTSGRVTGKGYDTAGIKYIHIANRLNELYGPGCFRTKEVFRTREFTRGQKNRVTFEVIAEITLSLGKWVEGEWQCCAEVFGIGCHQSISLGDAHKGASTNGFKKAAAMLGVGMQAWEGTLDDDHVPNDFSLNEQNPGSLDNTSKSFF